MTLTIRILVFWGFLDQVQTPQGACREAVRKILAFRRRKFPRDEKRISEATTAYCKARAGLSLEVLESVNTHLLNHLQTRAGELWHGHRVRLVDGTSVSMPDTAANQGFWP